MSLADRYAQLRDTDRVRERALFVSPRIPNELELQARWFAGDFGKEFVSTTGDKIEIVQFGTWNREAGPDFRDAAIRINGGDPIRGCIELDVTDRSWEGHGHATNPAFEETVLHVFVEKSGREFFTRTKSNRNVPQICIDLTALPDAFSANIPLARPGRCQAPLKDLPEERIQSVLDAAAQFRLRQKATRIRNKIDTHGRDEALFQEIAAALGYKENKLPFTLLAQRVPLKFLRENTQDCEALFFGVAGFLETPDLDVYNKIDTRICASIVGPLVAASRPNATAHFAGQSLADQQHASGESSPAAAGSAGNFSGAVVSSSARVGQRAAPPLRMISLQTLEHPFWNFHYTLTSEASAKRMALIGESRVAEILANVLFPFWLADDIDAWAEYAKLPAKLSNRRLETACDASFRK